MRSGTVKKWMSEKRFGFITPEDGGDDIFVHFRSLTNADCLSEGDEVTFEVEYDDIKGKYKAADCTLTSGGGGGGGGGEGGGGHRRGSDERRSYGGKDGGKGGGYGRSYGGDGGDGGGKGGRKGYAPY